MLSMQESCYPMQEMCYATSNKHDILQKNRWRKIAITEKKIIFEFLLLLCPLLLFFVLSLLGYFGLRGQKGTWDPPYSVRCVNEIEKLRK